MLFSLKYLGMTLVEQPKGEEMSAAAVKRIVATVSLRGGSRSSLFPGCCLSPLLPPLVTPIGCVWPVPALEPPCICLRDSGKG